MQNLILCSTNIKKNNTDIKVNYSWVNYAFNTRVNNKKKSPHKEKQNLYNKDSPFLYSGLFLYSLLFIVDSF